MPMPWVVFRSERAPGEWPGEETYPALPSGPEQRIARVFLRALLSTQASSPVTPASSVQQACEGGTQGARTPATRLRLAI